MFHLMVPWRERALAAERANPFSFLHDELFDRFIEGWLTPVLGTWRPAWRLDIEETDKEVIYRAEMPGFELPEIDVRVANDVLTIRAAHAVEAKGKEESVSTERRKVERTITLPPGTDPDRMSAVYRNGLLELRVPRVPKAEPRRIEVKT